MDTEPEISDKQQPQVTQQFPPPMPLYHQLKGAFMGLVFLTSCVLGTVLFHFPLLFLVKPFSYRLWLIFSRWFASIWFRFFLFVFENWNKIEVVYSGDEMKESDFGLLLCNHPSEADWLFFFSLANRTHIVERLRVVLKDILRKIPGAGWAIENLQFLFLSRNWEKDAAQINFICKEWRREGNLVVALFPEGTDFSPAKLQRSHAWAEQQNAPKFRRLLTPRTKGLLACRAGLGAALTHVYDVTLAYPGRVTPTLWSTWCGWFPRRLHLHLQRIPASEVPIAEEELTQWTWERWAIKDKMLQEFEVTGKLPGPLRQWGSAKNSLLPFIFWVPFTLVLVYWFYASWWFRLLQYTGWLFFGLTQFSEKFRIQRGVQAPLVGSKK